MWSRCAAWIANKCSPSLSVSCSAWPTPMDCPCGWRLRAPRILRSRSTSSRTLMSPTTLAIASRWMTAASWSRRVRRAVRSTGASPCAQLLTPPGWTRGAPVEVARGVIDDHPRFAWRALLLDSGRHFQSVAEIKKLIDWMSLNKLNVLLWHLTEDQGWRLEIPKYPELTKIGACRKAVGLDSELTGSADKPYCGFYTEAEVRDIVRYAAERFVDRRAGHRSSRALAGGGGRRIPGWASPASARLCGPTGASARGCSSPMKRPCSLSTTCSTR